MDEQASANGYEPGDLVSISVDGEWLDGEYLGFIVDAGFMGARALSERAGRGAPSSWTTTAVADCGTPALRSAWATFLGNSAAELLKPQAAAAIISTRSR